MRVLAAIGALLFLYLALIPAGLVYSTLDSACAGEGCETSVASRAGFTLLYAACLAAVLATAALFAHYALSGSLAAQRRLPRALALSGAVIGTALFVLFLIAFPLGGGVALVLAGGSLLAIRLSGRGSGEGGGRPRGGRPVNAGPTLGRLGPLPAPRASGNGAAGDGDATRPA